MVLLSAHCFGDRGCGLSAVLEHYRARGDGHAQNQYSHRLLMVIETRDVHRNFDGDSKCKMFTTILHGVVTIEKSIY